MTVVDAIIEIPEGSANKYEWDVRTQRIRLDRILWGAMHYPVNYGLVPDTWADDNDPLDVLVFSSHPLYPGIHVSVRILGSLTMVDEHGPDDKLLAVVHNDPRWSHIARLTDIAPHRLKEIRQFFQDYKTLQNLPTTIGDWNGESIAIHLVQRCQAQYQERLKELQQKEVGCGSSGGTVSGLHPIE